ncbi:hypothetical protein ASZ90_019544 [hydrocarbon metagenome]|uniref:tRNA(Met) cytidine acetate ligase n=1 Tax=hydrocarbon metagenome TaxID=938273 RepID=A0A0W8E3C5_9ZZZZ
MQILGIVAEYNPFHNGHLHLIEEAKKYQHFDAVVGIMSGNFMQRGEPAVCSKWARAEMALRCGMDLVIELPFIYAVRSAYYFARGAIESLSRTGIVSHLGFGSESGNLEQLKQIARVIAFEPADYRSILKEHLALGLSYPAARARALNDYLGHTGLEIEGLLLGPNNILALEYLRVIEEMKLPLHPLTVSRKGRSYHDPSLSTATLASATAIRRALFEHQNFEDIQVNMPQASWEVLRQAIDSGQAPVLPDSLEQAILSRLRTLSIHEIKQLYEVTEGLEYRIYEASQSCGTLAGLRQHIKSRRYSLTRINRILLYSLFGVSSSLVDELDKEGPTYLHILGFSNQGKQILKEINYRSSMRVLNRGKDVKSFYEENKGYPSGYMLELDIKATDIYSLLMPDPAARTAARDYTTSPVTI